MKYERVGVCEWVATGLEPHLEHKALHRTMSHLGNIVACEVQHAQMERAGVGGAECAGG
jgi:hypothetical protein